MPAQMSLTLAILHLIVVALHDLAHLTLAKHAGVSQALWVLPIVHALPALGAILLGRRRVQAGLGYLGLGLAGSLGFASYAHFVGDSPDHVSAAGSSAWGSVFVTTAWLLAAVDGVGLLSVMHDARRWLLPPGPRVVLIDGTCVFCNRLVSMILANDHQGVYYFAHLQGEYARAIKAKHGADLDDVDGVYLLVNPDTADERLLLDGAAGRVVWPSLFLAATPLLLLPTAVLDPFYRVFARYRYGWFGRYQVCRVPSPAERAKFLQNSLVAH